jgi:hypothetical protein
MFRYATLATAAVLALAAACSTDSTTAPSSGAYVPPSANADLDTARGRILAMAADSIGGQANALAPVLMLTDVGDTLRLVGPVAEFLVGGTAGVELWVAGTYEPDGSFSVIQYALRNDDTSSCTDPIVRIRPDTADRCPAVLHLAPKARATWAKGR